MFERLATATPEAPVALGRYDVLRRLGGGGMGTVYEGRDRERNTPVAVKTLLALDPTAGVQLKREFRTVADLAHPNLGVVYELACEEGLWFFAMELIDGVDFRHWARGPRRDARSAAAAATTELKSQTPAVQREAATDPQASRAQLEAEAVTLPVRDFDALHAAFAQLVEGILALHRADLWHGDVKPRNVLVRSDGRVVVLDFGLARPVGHRSVTATSGTPAYMAPEQLIGGRVGPQSDWYALGTMMYEILTGRLPFGSGRDPVALYESKTLSPPPAPHLLNTEIPRELSDLCVRLLAPEPEHRPSGEELSAFFTGAPSRAPLATKRASTGLVGREHEFEVLTRAHALSRAGHCVLTHVHGPSGIGKSAVVRSFLAAAEAAGTIVLRGRCYERESVPYNAFDGIVDELATHLVRMGPDAASALPEWTPELAQVFPVLASVPAVASAALRAPVEDGRELRRRALTALRELLVDLSQRSSLVLWVDDLQWADADSAQLLESITRYSGRCSLLLLLSFRSADAASNDVLRDHFSAAASRVAAKQLVDLAIGPLPRAQAERLAQSILEQLGAELPLTRVRDVAREAGGVPFFVEELCRYVAAADGAERDIHVSLDDAVASRLGQLSEAQRRLVEVVSVSDSPVAQSIAFEAAGMGADALPALLALRNASLLSCDGPGAQDLVSTYHDRIRESALAALDPATRCQRHLALGRALATAGVNRDAGPWIFDATRHLEAGAPALRDPDERLRAAELHRRAGKAARRAAAFPLAFARFEAGIALLPSDAWRSHYDLALDLHAGAAQAAYLSSEWAALDERVADVKSHGRTTMDQLPAWEAQIDALVGRHEYLAAVDVGMQALELLEVHLPRDPQQEDIVAVAVSTLTALQRIGAEGLEALPDVDDPVVAAAIRIQVRVSPAAYFGKPTLLPVIAANLVNTSIERGLSVGTPYALALFGIVLNTMGQYPVAHEFGQLAIRLIDRWDDRSLEAATRHVVLNLVCPWMVPLKSILEPLREVFDIGRRLGDLEYASYAAHGYTHNAMYVGRPLAPLLEEALALGDQMRALGQVNAVHVHAPFEQLLKAWTGRLEDSSRLNDATFDEDEELALAAEQGSRSGTFILRFVMGLGRFHFGHARDASACFEVAREYLDAAPSVWHMPILHQFAPLAAWEAWPELSEAERSALRPKLEASLAALQALSGHAPVNFAHRVSLVEGALSAIDGDPVRALGRFELAVRQASDADWVSDIALAKELAARVHDDPSARRQLLEDARRRYAAWGATAKAARLDARLATI